MADFRSNGYTVALSCLAVVCIRVSFGVHRRDENSQHKCLNSLVKISFAVMGSLVVKLEVDE
jgi:hypothetical protein